MKNEIIEKIFELVKSTNYGQEIESIKLENENIVKINYLGGAEKYIDITANSDIATIQDVIKKIIY